MMITGVHLYSDWDNHGSQEAPHEWWPLLLAVVFVTCTTSFPTVSLTPPQHPLAQSNGFSFPIYSSSSLTSGPLLT